MARHFDAAGFHIRTFSRSQPPRDLFPQDSEFFAGDITSSTIEAAVSNVQVVVHLAGLLHINNPPSSLAAEYERVNLQGTKNVLAAAVEAGVDRIVLSSTIAVYGDSQGRILDEEGRPAPGTLYGQTKLAAEQIVLSARRRDGSAPGSVLRLAAVYGPRVKGNYRRLVKSLARGRFVPLGDGLNRRSLVYDEDVGRAFVLAATHPLAGGRVYNVTDGEVHTLNEIIATICESLGRRRPRISIPLAPARILAGAVEQLAYLTGYKAPVSRETINKYTEDLAVAGDRIQAELGFVPLFDLRAGWKQTIWQMRRSGQL